MSNTQQQRLVVEQLRREAAIKRISVRQAVADIMVNYIIIFPFLQNIFNKYFFFFFLEICVRSPTGRLSYDWFQFSKSKSVQREKQLLTIINLAK